MVAGAVISCSVGVSIAAKGACCFCADGVVRQCVLNQRCHMVWLPLSIAPFTSSLNPGSSRRMATRSADGTTASTSGSVTGGYTITVVLPGVGVFDAGRRVQRISNARIVPAATCAANPALSAASCTISSRNVVIVSPMIKGYDPRSNHVRLDRVVHVNRITQIEMQRRTERADLHRQI